MFSLLRGFPVSTDVFASDAGYKFGYDFDITTISGNVNVNYLDAYSCALNLNAISGDIFCSLLDLSSFYSDVLTTPGVVTYIGADSFSSYHRQDSFSFNVDLYSLKIDNFSLDVGEYTYASGCISFDVVDDECPVSVSGTNLLVNSIKVSTTYSGIENGWRFYYDPVDDFSSLSGPTTFTVHAENACGDELEYIYYLVFGYFVEYRPLANNANSFGYGSKVLVRITAEDFATCPSKESLAWEFETRNFVRRDLSASIVCIPANKSTKSDLTAEIYPLSTAYYYGKEFTVIINAKDFGGNVMQPYSIRYTIEDKPG